MRGANDRKHQNDQHEQERYAHRLGFEVAVLCR
jgi:hypothetical protein